MLELNSIGIWLARAIVAVIGVGYSVLGLMVYRQVVILCKILGTNLAVLLKLLALTHLIIIVLGSLLVFILI